MAEVVTLWSFMVQIVFSLFLQLENPKLIPVNFSTWTENGQNWYLTWQAVTWFVFSCDKMWFLLLSNELRLHMVHNYILIYVRNWLRILGKWNALIFNMASIHLPDKEIEGQKHNANMVSDASPGTAAPNLSFMWLMCLPTVHAHRMGTWNVPIQPLLMEIWGGTVVDFWVVLGLRDIGHVIS